MILLIVFFFGLSSCHSRHSRKSLNAAQPEFNRDVPGWQAKAWMDQTARFLAGRPQRKESPLYEYSQTNAEYRQYAQNVQNLWQDYYQRHALPVGRWRRENLMPVGSYQHVFYPFSGPDITNALLFLPHARSYTLIGLESPADFPRINGKNLDGINQDIHSMLHAASGSLRRIFFMTNYMAKRIGKSNYNGVAAIMMFFLSGLEYEILDGYRITLDESGQMVRDSYFYSKQGKKPKNIGFMLFFRKNRFSGTQKVIFHQGNVSDNSLFENANLSRYLKNLPPGRATMMKSASYLLYNETFDNMRSVVLSTSKFILTDSSGIPFYYINNQNWHCKFFGMYRRPVSLFADRHEPLLAQAMQENSKGPLPFEYGYRKKSGEAHLLLIERSANSPYTKPIFDSGWNYGFESKYIPGKEKMIRIDRHKIPYTDKRVKLPPMNHN